MKPTPLYELTVATKDRPRIFRFVVIGSFMTSVLTIAVCTVVLLTEQKGAGQNFLSQKQTVQEERLSNTLGIAVAAPNAKKYAMK